jgi:hypothetical protein
MGEWSRVFPCPAFRSFLELALFGLFVPGENIFFFGSEKRGDFGGLGFMSF